MTLLILLLLQSSTQNHADIMWQAYQIERMQSDIGELKAKIEKDATQDMKLAVLESRIADLPTTADTLKLLGELGLLAGAAKGGQVLYKRRKEG